MDLHRRGSLFQQDLCTKNMTHGKLHSAADSGRIRLHRLSHTFHISSAGPSRTKCIQIHSYKQYKSPYRLYTLCHSRGIQVHKLAHSGRSAEAIDCHGSFHSDQGIGSRLSSLSGTGLVCTVGSTRPPLPQLRCPQGRRGRSAGSTAPVNPCTHTLDTGPLATSLN